MLTRRLLLGLAAVVSWTTMSDVRADDAVVVQSAHYRLTSKGPRPEAEEWSRMLEAAWPQFAEFFGKAPALAKDERLSVAFFETPADMDAAIRRAGGTPPVGEGGYYDPVSKTTYEFRQPSAWYTRALLLHECAHQFHYRARGLTTLPAFWYVEGIAEHLARHTWDGTKLRLGVVPMLSLEQYSAKALNAVTAPGFDLGRALDEAKDAQRPVAMHVVRYLCTSGNAKLRRKFDEIGDKVERGTKLDGAAVVRALGPSAAFVAAWRSWLETVQEPWEVLTVDWDARAADALRGAPPGFVGLCRRRAPTKRVSTVLRPVGDGVWKAGVLLRYADRDDYDLLMIRDAAHARVERRKDGGWTTLPDVDVRPTEDGAWRVEAVRDGVVVKCSVNGVAVGELEAPAGSMGLAVESSTVDFTEIRAE